MSYLNVISLERAKNYLRVDESLTEDDSEITSMINGACRYVENRTNHILFPRQKIYEGSCQVKVYDFPINEITTNPAPWYVKRSLYTVFPDVKTVELNVGYATGDVPDDIQEEILRIIKLWYFDSEKQINTSAITDATKEVLDLYKRFL